MCGRFSLVPTPEELTNTFFLKINVAVTPRYNIAPGQQVLIIRQGERGKKISAVRWGLLPHWAKDEKLSHKLINARAETVQDKPVFQDAFKERRCIVPATGFYEWKTVGNRKQPYFIKMNNGRLFAMAGIWESWQGPKGEAIESCAILTTDANTIVGKIHDRMPVILPQSSYGLWLDPIRNGQSYHEYFHSYDPFKMTAYQVSSMVNNVKNEGEGCIKRIDYA
jgi:putative SOS response-associated peptidase YedK